MENEQMTFEFVKDRQSKVLPNYGEQENVCQNGSFKNRRPNVKPFS